MIRALKSPVTKVDIGYMCQDLKKGTYTQPTHINKKRKKKEEGRRRKTRVCGISRLMLVKI